MNRTDGRIDIAAAVKVMTAEEAKSFEHAVGMLVKLMLKYQGKYPGNGGEPLL